MNIVVVGYGKMFSNLILGVLESGHKVVGVFRNDRVSYSNFFRFFKDIFAPSADYSFIKSLGLYDIDADSVNSEKFRRKILHLNPDIILVGSWGERFQKETIDLPKIACINTHPSLLPKYRGPNPYSRVIMNGETVSGLTFHIMDEKLDNGPVLMQKKVEIIQGFNGDTGGSLKNKTCNLARHAIKELLETMDNEIIIPIAQKSSEATYFSQIKEDEIIVDFEWTSEKIDRLLRGLSPWQSAYFPHGNTFFKVQKWSFSDNYSNCARAGTIVKKSWDKISVVTGDDKILNFYKPLVFGKIRKYFTGLYIKLFVKIGDFAQ